jgi:hypothetical protein
VATDRIINSAGAVRDSMWGTTTATASRLSDEERIDWPVIAIDFTGFSA